MAENNTTSKKEALTIRYPGRFEQVGIYFMKFLRMFVYQSDWKVLPMTALIAALVGFVMGRKYMVTMDGTLTGTFALVCVCIWNGCFNSIQVICRERDVIKREHRSGMHISSYVVSHMIYQFILCLLQTIITIYITKTVGMNFPEQGMFTKWYIVEFGFTLMLITYAADMMSLWISALSSNTTTAMTIMPFVLVFQLIFSGGVIAIPLQAQPIASFTVSNPGFNALASQADVNSMPFDTVSRMVMRMKDTRIEGTITFGQLMDALSDKEAEKETDPAPAKDSSPKSRKRDMNDLIHFLKTNPSAKDYREIPIPVSTTLGELMDVFGEKAVKEYIDEGATKANYRPKYEHSSENIIKNWLHLGLFILVFFTLTIITLEPIDKDKR